MELKKMVIILSITITIIIGLSLGISYGWYAYNNAETNIESDTKSAPTIIFAQTEYISTSQTLPILDEDRYNFASKNSFTVTLEENLSEYETAIEISLKDIAMSNELKIENYKYELLQDGGVVANGNFKNIGSATVMKILPMNILKPNSYPKTYTYELYIWLSDNGQNQNELMNKGFSAKIDVTSAMKK